MHTSGSALHGDEIAIIGITGRFPHAGDLDRFWQNLRDGHESIDFFSDGQLLDAGLDPSVLSHPNFVRAGSVLEDIDLFDASFFGYTPGEAEMMDPQHRLFLECCWHALENAGYDPDSFPHRIGVFATVSANSYLLNLYSNREVLISASPIQLHIANEKDHLTTRVSYKLNLRGPSFCVQSACSSSLLSVHVACQSLLNGECEMALAGGVTIRVPDRTGYVYQEGGIASSDGHCRAFDAKAQGTIGGNGVGVVVLKSLELALAHGDTIHAVIKGSAINNDGSHKIGYTAPSVDGQAAVITDALAIARVDPATISYIEAHGTGTVLGDPIEVMALTKAFRTRTQVKNFCALGSAKTNVGHLDVAAGITGLLKTVLALKHRQLPPSLNFVEPNPQIDFANSPFYVNTTLADWERNGSPLRAGVSSFGTGGTNVHVVLEEAPEAVPSDVSDKQQLILISACSEPALEKASANLATFLQQQPEVNLADVAYTLKVGRRAFMHRRAIVCRDVSEAAQALLEPSSTRVVTGEQHHERISLAFMFPGQGTQYPNMTRQLYEAEPAYREQVDLCAKILKQHLGLDLRETLYATTEKLDQATQELNETAITQPALFVVEYALARLWLTRGVRPEALIGHSVGEYVAACLAGVFTLEDALRLVAARGHVMQKMERGSMLAVNLPETEVEQLLGDELSLAAVNAPAMCVVSGPTPVVERLENELNGRGVRSVRLQTSHAFHSSMTEPILAEFGEECSRITLREPRIPYVSNLTGTWITANDALDVNYWVRHLRQTVRFADGVRALLAEPGSVLLEVGPGETLSRLAKLQQEPGAKEICSFGSLCGPTVGSTAANGEIEHLLRTQGKLWVAGVSIDWNSSYAGERRRRLPLPVYPFERQRYWVEPSVNGSHSTAVRTMTKKDLADWFYHPSWKRTPPLQVQLKQDPSEEHRPWLVFIDECGLGAQVVERLAAAGKQVVTVQAGTEFTQTGEGSYELDPQRPEDYERLLDELTAAGCGPTRIIHFWSVTRGLESTSEREAFEQAQHTGFYSLLWLVHALRSNSSPSLLNIGVVTNNVHDVTGEEDLSPEKSTILSACRVIPQEYLSINCLSIDIVLPEHGSEQERKLIEHLIAEMLGHSAELSIAYRGNSRWIQTFEPLTEMPFEGESKLRERGVYLITGGLGGVGTVLAEHLAKSVRARLILTGRTELPPREDWQRWLDEHGESDHISEKLTRVMRLEELGAEVLAVSADVSNREQMGEVLRLATERFGEMNGVIHAAGNVGDHSFQNVQATGREECEWQFQPKAHGVMVLADLLEQKPIDFCMMVSSLSTVIGGFGLFAYSAANTYIDAFAQKLQTRHGLPWMTVNWDGWKLREKVDLISMEGERLAELAITPPEGAAAFERVLSLAGVPQVVVSTGDLESRIKQWVKLEVIRGAVEKKTDGRLLRARPNLQTEYVAPHDQIEKTLVEIWQDLFGIDRIGIRDSFFELGGHSLLALSMTGQTYQRLGQEIPMATLYEGPTIEHLARVINERGWPGILKLVDKLPKAYAPLVSIRPTGTKPPFFFAAPLGGVLPSNVLVGVLDLARHLDSEQPFYGLQLPGLVQELGSLLGPGEALDVTEFQARFLQTIQEKPAREMIAEGAIHCVRAIRNIQPQGPYLIGGFCTGGIVALEVAQHLREQGEEVSVLALVDTYPPVNAGLDQATTGSNGGPPPPDAIIESSSDDAELDSIVWFVGRDLTGGQLAKDLPQLKEDMQQLSTEERWEYSLEQMRSINAASAETTASDIARLYMIYQVNLQTLGLILNNYTPEPYQGRIALFTTQSTSGEAKDDQIAGWNNIATTPVEVFDVPGDHGTLFLEPNINVLVNNLTRCLETTERQLSYRASDNGHKQKPASPAAPVAPTTVEPETATEPEEVLPETPGVVVLQLKDIWHDVLSRRPATTREDFFEVGGNRQRAVQLAERIRMRIGHSLSPATIIQNPTIEQLAVVIDKARGWPSMLRVQKQTRIESPLITVQPDGMKRPFFFASPLGGIFSSQAVKGSMLSLLPHLDPERPYYGLQLPGLAQRLASQLHLNRNFDPARIQELVEQLPGRPGILAAGAAQCVRAMHSVQPHGPYFIGGFKSGGLLALEIANQLKRDGDEVSLLALVDTAPGASCTEAELGDEVALLAQFISETMDDDRSPQQLYEYLANLKPAKRWRYALERARERGIVHEGEGTRKLRNIFKLYSADRLSLNLVLASYAPLPYEGQIKLVLSDDFYREAGDITDGWIRYATEPEVRVVPAQHRKLFDGPVVETVASALEDLIAEAELKCGDAANVAIAARAGNAGESVAPVSVIANYESSQVPRFVSREVTLEDTYRYQVYLPANYTPEKKWPVILSLHGTGENGDDGMAQTRMGLGLALRKNAWKHSCVVVMPQCRPNRFWWDPQMEAQAIAALNQTIDEMNGDPQRLYLTGFSSGGFACWVFAAKYYGKFAAMATMDSPSPLVGTTDEENAVIPQYYKNMAVWVFHGETDPIVSVGEPRKLVQALKDAGGSVRYTEYKELGHGAWVQAYEDPDLMSWLLSQHLAE